MFDIIKTFLSLAVVAVPAAMSVCALLWWAFCRIGVVRPMAQFSAYDVRTWPLSLALVDAAVFALVAAAAATTLGTGFPALIIAVVTSTPIARAVHAWLPG
jgi:hypothetical protein